MGYVATENLGAKTHGVRSIQHVGDGAANAHPLLVSGHQGELGQFGQ